MDQSIERALTSLIPALTGPLPAKLVELAISLLAQSRSRASNLKAEEEIARAYACANLACERLKQTLNLPKIDPRPPCPPRVYKKLYKYLEQVLPATHRTRPLRSSPPPTTTSRKTTRSSSNVHPEPDQSKPPHSGTNSSKARPAESSSVKTVSSKPSLTAIGTKSTPNNQTGHHHQRIPRSGALPESEIPAWARPLINHLCAHVFRPHAAGYVFLGLRVVLTRPPPLLTPNKPQHASSSSRERNMTDKIPALIIALCVYVTTRLSGMPLTQDTLNAYKKGALAVLDLPEFAADNGGIEKIRAADIEDWMWQLSEKGWMDHKWYQKVPIGDDPALLAREISGAVDEGLDFDDEDDDDDMDMDIDEDDGTVVVATTTTTTIAADKGWNETSSSRKATSTPLGGLDTMIQSKVDYLSEEKRAEYLEWKERIGKRVAEIETARGGKSGGGGGGSGMTMSS